MIYSIFSATFMMYIYYHTVDFPNADDYTSIIEPVSSFLRHGNFKDLISPHSQHIQLTSRLISLFYLEVFGSIRFDYLMMTGAIGIICLPLVLGSAYMLPGAFLLFQPGYSEAILWATASVPNIWVITLAALSFRSYYKGKFIYSWLYSILASFTWGSGILAPIIIALSLIFRGKFLYSIFFTSIPLSFYVLSSDASPVISTDSLVYGLKALGSGFSFSSGTLALFFGLMLVILALSCSANQKLCLFIIGTCLLIGIGRSHLSQDSSFLTSRYHIYAPIVLLAAFPRGIQVFSVLFCILSFIFFHQDLLMHKNVLETARIRWQVFNDGLLPENVPHIKAIHIESSKLLSNLSTKVAPSREGICPESVKPWIKKTRFRSKSIYRSSEYFSLSGYWSVRDIDQFMLKINHSKCFISKTYPRPDLFRTLKQRLFGERYGFYFLVPGIVNHCELIAIKNGDAFGREVKSCLSQ